MLTGLKVWSLTYECIFYRSEDNAKGGLLWIECSELNFECFEMLKRNVLTDRAQRVDEKNVVIFPVSILTPRVIAIKISKIAHYLYFLLMTAKN